MKKAKKSAKKAQKIALKSEKLVRRWVKGHYDHEENVVVTRVNSDFVQRTGSCVMASYAVAASYFTHQHISVYFEGYCRHFQLPFTDAIEAEKNYASHFDREWRRRNVRGYEVVLDLHRTSREFCFAEARSYMDGFFFVESDVDQLEGLLRERVSFLNVTYEPGGNEYHSITVCSDGKYLFARDTNRKNLYLIQSLHRIGKLRDSVIYVQRN